MKPELPPPPRLSSRWLVAVISLVIFAVAAVTVYVLTRSSSNTVKAREFRHLVALGDSFSAAPFVPDSDIASGCFRSTNNYPSLLSRSLRLRSFADVTCSGADTEAITAPSRTQLLIKVPAQIDAVTETTDLVTLGIGGNDFELFSSLTSECPKLRAKDPQGAPCEAEMSASGQDQLITQIPQIIERIDGVVAAIRERAPDAVIVLVGYPDVVPNDDTCDELPLADGDYAYVDRVASELNQAMRTAAAVAKVEFIDVWTASQGHDICSAEPWVNGQYTSRQAFAYHPFAVHQAAVAEMILEALGQTV